MGLRISSEDPWCVSEGRSWTPSQCGANARDPPSAPPVLPAVCRGVVERSVALAVNLGGDVQFTFEAKVYSCGPCRAQEGASRCRLKPEKLGLCKRTITAQEGARFQRQRGRRLAQHSLADWLTGRQTGRLASHGRLAVQRVTANPLKNVTWLGF